MIRNGLWSRQLWKIEGLPHSCFGVFRYRNGPTDLFPIAWPCCYRIQVHRTNGHFSRSGSLIPRERLLLAKIISRRPIPRSVARNGQHCVFNWDAACRSPLVTFIANRVFDSCHAVPQSDVTRRLSVIPCLLTPAKFVAWRNIHIRIKHTELWLAVVGAGYVKVWWNALFYECFRKDIVVSSTFVIVLYRCDCQYNFLHSRPCMPNMPFRFNATLRPLKPQSFTDWH